MKKAEITEGAIIVNGKEYVPLEGKEIWKAEVGDTIDLDSGSGLRHFVELKDISVFNNKDWIGFHRTLAGKKISVTVES